jgi:hypothetical protein
MIAGRSARMRVAEPSGRGRRTDPLGGLERRFQRAERELDAVAA